MLQWSSEFDTGVPLVDTQHRVLFAQINRLEEILELEEIDPTEVGRLLEFIEGYVTSHFHFEEKCMFRHGCPAHEENVREHISFLEAFGKLKTEFQRVGPSREFLQKLYGDTRTWIHHHIMKVDIQLRDSVRPVPAVDRSAAAAADAGPVPAQPENQ